MLLKQSTARNVPILMVQSADHITGLASATLTIAASKDGAAFATITPTVTELANGWYSLALTTTHTNTLGALALHITAASGDPTDTLHEVVADLPGATVSSVTGAVGSVTGAVGSVTGAVGSVTAGVTVTTNNDKTGYTASTVSDKTGYSIATGGIGAGAHASGELNNIADSVLDRNMATGTDSGTDSTSVRTARQALRSLRNKAAIAAGTLTVTKEDDTTASWTAAVTTTAGNPISAVDPT